MEIMKIQVDAHLSAPELAFLDAECKRMDAEEPLSEGKWTGESVLEAWLQIAIDRRRGVDEDPLLRELRAACREMRDSIYDWGDGAIVPEWFVAVVNAFEKLEGRGAKK